MGSNNLRELENTLQKDVEAIKGWAKKWGLIINGEKSKALIITKNHIKYIPKIKIGGNIVKLEDHIKILGVTVDKSLNWRKHIEDICDKCRGPLNIMRSLTGKKWGLSTKTLLTIYKSLILSRIDYGDFLYKNASKSVLNNLNSIQYKALSVAFGSTIGTSLKKLLI